MPMASRVMRSRIDSGACAKLWLKQGRHFTARSHPMPVSPCSPRPWLAVALFGLLASFLAPARAAVPVDDAVEASIAGEFPLSAGKLDEAARWYQEAARASGDDAGMASRSAEHL